MFLIKMQADGKGYSSVKTVRGQASPAKPGLYHPGDKDHITCGPFLYYEGMYHIFVLQRNYMTAGDAGKWGCKTTRTQYGRIILHKAEINAEPCGHG